jgi:hypothetical protein
VVKPLDIPVFERKLTQHCFREGTTQDWYFYPVPETLDSARGMLVERIRVISINEIGITAALDRKVSEGDRLEFNIPLLSELGIRCRIGRVEKVEPRDNGSVCKVSFLGLDEQDRRKLRLECRRLFHIKS